MYKTSDLYLAAFLSAEGYRLESTERVGSRVVFCFELDDMQGALVAWAGRTAVTNAAGYADAVKRFKGLLYV
jgi:hypothetical protein